jgi:hypothetical protein
VVEHGGYVVEEALGLLDRCGSVFAGGRLGGVITLLAKLLRVLGG